MNKFSRQDVFYAHLGWRVIEIIVDATDFVTFAPPATPSGFEYQSACLSLLPSTFDCFCKTDKPCFASLYVRVLGITFSGYFISKENSSKHIEFDFG
jgi:hypothetical protein